MYKLAFYTHVVLSLSTLIVGLAAVSLALYKRKKEEPFSINNTVTNATFVGLMYVQSILGLTMYYFPRSKTPLTESSAIDPGNSLELRFWEIEHVAIMIFALFLVQIGYIFIVKTKSHPKKYILTIWYFGIPLLMMIFTMVMAML